MKLQKKIRKFVKKSQLKEELAKTSDAKERHKKLMDNLKEELVPVHEDFRDIVAGFGGEAMLDYQLRMAQGAALQSFVEEKDGKPNFLPDKLAAYLGTTLSYCGEKIKKARTELKELSKGLEGLTEDEAKAKELEAAEKEIEKGVKPFVELSNTLNHEIVSSLYQTLRAKEEAAKKKAEAEAKKE